jgi:hypothetical protein
MNRETARPDFAALCRFNSSRGGGSDPTAYASIEPSLSVCELSVPDAATFRDIAAQHLK